MTLRHAFTYPSWHECRVMGLVDLPDDDEDDDELDPDDLDGLHDPVGEDGDEDDDDDDVGDFYDPELDDYEYEEPPPHYGHRRQ